jgi:GNAT superfamily N-acetyltransferase
MWESIGGWSEREYDEADAPYRDWLRGEIARRRLFAFVAETSSGEIVASGGIWLQPVQPRPGRLNRPEMPYILSMYTDPRFRGRGVAARIVAMMLKWAQKRGHALVVLHASTMGRPIYEGLGFHAGVEMGIDLLPPSRDHSS